jgi:plasmid stability protein
MPSLTIKNIPDELYENLKQAASAHRRSINSELIVCLEKAFLPTKPSTAVLLGEAKRLRERFHNTTLSGAQINAAKIEGRQ